MPHTDALVMFSGGLDSILAAKTLAAQGLRVHCLHFVSPFFGHPDRVAFWRETYSLDIEVVDVGQAFIDMMAARPAHGVGKVLNPCVDCKILMLRRCKAMLPALGAAFIATGEVKGQRPMSQRRDALDVISKESGVRGVLLRPLCARNCKPTPMEETGLVDRERLHNISGRGRKSQMLLARQLGVTVIPQPGGGCKLTDMDSARRFFPVFAHCPAPRVKDFQLANLGRQFWAGPLWMAMGRNDSDNQALAAQAEPGDWLLDLRDYPSPLTLLRALGDAAWDQASLEAAAALTASFSPKSKLSGQPAVVLATRGEETRELVVTPRRDPACGPAEPTWDQLAQGKQALFGPEAPDDY